MAWTGPNAITKSGTVVFGPSLTTPLPNHGSDIVTKIYLGINAPYSPPPVGGAGTYIGPLGLTQAS